MNLTYFKEYRKVVVNKQKMQEQKSENEMVMQEFGMLGDDANVYKLVGPILAKQGLGECKENVEKRLEFINKEVVRLDALETAFQAKITEKTAEIKKMQSDFQRVAMAAQQAAQ